MGLVRITIRIYSRLEGQLRMGLNMATVRELIIGNRVNALSIDRNRVNALSIDKGNGKS